MTVDTAVGTTDPHDNPGRPDDADREAVVARLRTAVGHGRLDLTEFDRRAARAYAAGGHDELAELVADLAPRGPWPPRMADRYGPAMPTPPGRVSPGVAAGPAPVTATAVPAAPAGPALARFGAMLVADGTVHTPSGSFPLAGSRWRCYQYWYPRRVVPGWAIAAAVLGFLVVPFVSLLFLLVREDRPTGVVQVAVDDGYRQHVVDLPVGDSVQAQAVAGQVERVQALAG